MILPHCFFLQRAIEEYRKNQEQLMEKELIERQKKELLGLTTKKIQVRLRGINAYDYNVHF
jgi:hypothetical protein